MEKMDIGVLPKVEMDKADNDYIEDGILYCGECNTPKQKVITTLGRTMTVNCNCECKSKVYDESRLEAEEKERNIRIQRLKSQGVQDKTAREHLFANDDGGFPKLKQLALDYVENWKQIYKDNNGLLFWGDVGNGKTFYAHCIANELIDRGVPCMITDFIKLLNKVQGFDVDKNEFYNELNSYKLLVIDDLGAERQSEYAMEQIYNIINQRYKNGQPTIFTTNISITELKNPKNIEYSRIYDRILEMCTPVKFNNGNRRADIGKSKDDKLMKLLGLKG